MLAFFFFLFVLFCFSFPFRQQFSNFLWHFVYVSIILGSLLDSSAVVGLACNLHCLQRHHLPPPAFRSPLPFCIMRLLTLINVSSYCLSLYLCLLVSVSVLVSIWHSFYCAFTACMSNGFFSLFFIF